MSTETTRQVRLREDATHAPCRLRGEKAHEVEEARMSFGSRWLRLRFPKDQELWARADRDVEALL